MLKSKPICESAYYQKCSRCCSRCLQFTCSLLPLLDACSLLLNRCPGDEEQQRLLYNYYPARSVSSSAIANHRQPSSTAYDTCVTEKTPQSKIPKSKISKFKIKIPRSSLCTLIRCTSIKYTSMKYTFMRYIFMKYTLMRYIL